MDKDVKDNFTPLVSVCIPVYNGGKYINEAIQSVIDQRYPSIEILIQDNASTDDTWTVVQDFAQRHPQVSIQRNAKNIGMAPNWNKVISRAQGDYIMLMSADDMMKEKYLARTLEVFRDHDVDVVTTNHYWLKGTSTRKRFEFVYGGAYQYFSRQLLLYNPFPVVFALFKRSTVTAMMQQGKLFNESFPYTCDYELLIRMALAGTRLFYLEKPFAYYRLHKTNLSRQVIRMNRQATMALLRHGRELRQLGYHVYYFTLTRFLLRVFRNLLWYGRFDKRLFSILWHEVTHADRRSPDKDR